MNALAKQLMKRGRTSRQRALGRALSRGRFRGPEGLLMAAQMADRIAKDFGGAPAGATTAASVYTPVPSERPKRVTKKSRLAIPYVRDDSDF